MAQADVIRLLAKYGADLDAQDKKGRTPLHRATYEGRVAAAEALLEAGADPFVTNKSGKERLCHRAQRGEVPEKRGRSSQPRRAGRTSCVNRAATSCACADWAVKFGPVTANVSMPSAASP